MLPLLLILASVLACQSDQAVAPTRQVPGGGESVDTGATGAAEPPLEDPPSEYIYEEDPVEPAFDLTQVQAAIEDGLSAWRSLDPGLVFRAFDTALATGDSGCPTRYEYYLETYGYDYWYGPCEAGTGTRFDGSIYGVDYDPYDSGYYHYDLYGWWYGDSATRMVDGQRFDLSGYFYATDYVYTYYNQRYFYYSFTGGAHWSGAAYEHTWLGQSLSLSLVTSGAWTLANGGYLSVDGGLSGYGGSSGSIDFDHVFMGSAGWGSSCPQEPSGVISVRDGQGDWYNVEFHGPAYLGAESIAPRCDGCGTVWWRGKELGSVCPDVSALGAWEGVPW